MLPCWPCFDSESSCPLFGRGAWMCPSVCVVVQSTCLFHLCMCTFRLSYYLFKVRFVAVVSCELASTQHFCLSVSCADIGHQDTHALWEIVPLATGWSVLWFTLFFNCEKFGTFWHKHKCSVGWYWFMRCNMSNCVHLRSCSPLLLVSATPLCFVILVMLHPYMLFFWQLGKHARNYSNWASRVVEEELGGWYVGKYW